ncbi:MAG: ATP-binding protein [Ignavibacteria bacterium]|nr:ATP-binding protein [Ignavibacteria bacterium]
MKFSFKNIGVLNDSELSLKPLTIILGPNNTNKTYLSYNIYGIFQYILYNRIFKTLNFKKEIKGSKILISKQVFLRKVNLAINKFIKEKYIKNLSIYFQDYSNKIFAKASIAIHFTEKDLDSFLLKEHDDVVIESTYNIYYNFKLNKNYIEIQVSKITQDDSEKNNLQITQSHVLKAANELILTFINSHFDFPFLLPAERNAFILTYKILQDRRFKSFRAEKSLIRHRGNLSYEMLDPIGYELGHAIFPRPIEDYLDFLNDISSRNTADLKRRRVKSKFYEFAILCEKILTDNNKIQFVKQRENNLLKLNLDGKFDIDFYNASSSIKQLSGLILFLKYYAREGGLLIIDEPEMNLHPDTQVKLLEILSILVSLGVNILITTHSPYFMAHLNNLINENKDKNVLRKQSNYLFLKDERAFISASNVSAYEVKNNVLNEIKDIDGEVRWEALSNTFSEIQSKFFEIHAITKNNA